MKKVPSGFTLVELMSTVAIIGILATFAVPTYQDYIVKEQLRSIEVAAEHIHMAQTRFFSDHMSLPGGARYARTLTELTPYLPGTSVLRHAGNTRSRVLGTNEASSTVVGDSFICSFTAANVTDYKNHYIVDFKFPSSGKSIVSNSNKYKMYYRAQASDAVTQITWRNVSGGELPRIK